MLKWAEHEKSFITSGPGLVMDCSYFVMRPNNKFSITSWSNVKIYYSVQNYHTNDKTYSSWAKLDNRKHSVTRNFLTDNSMYRKG